jgi:hypothetical protein
MVLTFLWLNVVKPQNLQTNLDSWNSLATALNTLL